MDIQITSYDLDLLRGNILDVLDPDLAEVVNGAEPRGESVVLHFPSEDAAEAFLDVVAEESNLALGDLPAKFDELLDRLEDQVDRGGV
jgi:hypothetical protein